MGAELAGNAVEIVIRAFVSIEFTGKVFIRAVQFPHPGALDDFDGIRQHLRSCLTGFFLDQALLQLEIALGHFLGGLISRPGQLDGFLEGGGLIVNKVESALTRAENVLRRIGRIAATQKHGIVIFTGHVIGLHQRVRAQIGGAVLTQRADYHGGHREEQRGLIKIIHDAKILKTAHNGLLCIVIIIISEERGQIAGNPPRP